MIKKTTTCNGALSCQTSGSNRLNLFYRTIRNIEKECLFDLLEKSWNENQLDTLKLIFYTRDCRGGKGEREVFHDCVEWLILNHPEDFLVNIEIIPDYGRWEDLLRYIGVEEGGIGQAIAKLFAKQLSIDVEQMNDGKPVTLCAKWAPTENCKYDKKCRAVKLICKELGIKMSNYRKDYISPLRSYINVVERFASLGEWQLIDYSKVPGHCMKKLMRAFKKHDTERFEEYKSKLERGDPETKVNAQTIEPHEIVREYLNGDESSIILDGQWKEIVKRVKGFGTMDRALPLVDVSASMNGQPITISIALGLIISELSMPPFNGKMITFETEPQMFHIDDSISLFERVKMVQSLPWGGSTNFSLVFLMILEYSIQEKLSPDEMPTSIYVISDMQFNSADNNSMTNLEYIKRSYEEAGYELPKLVFWNVNGCGTDYITDNPYEENVVTISGFSTSLFKSILEGDDFSPFGLLMKILENERYSSIKLASAKKD